MSKFHHVLCTLPHASTTINGVPFARHALGMLSVDPVEGDHLKVFSAIAGFRLVSAEGLTEDEAKAIDAQKAAQAADLAATAATAAAAAAASKAAPVTGTQQAATPPVDGDGQSGAGAEGGTGSDGGTGTEGGTGAEGSGTEGGGQEGGEQSSSTAPADKAAGTDKPAEPAKAAGKKKAVADKS